MPLSAEQLELGRSRLKQIFSYLHALNELRNPVVTNVIEQPWSLFLSDLPEHPLVRRGWIETSDDVDQDSDDPFVLKVGRPRDPRPCPAAPAILDGWLHDGWQRLNASVDVQPEIVFVEDDQQITERFDAEPKRVAGLNTWKRLREEWQKSERPVVETQKLFEQLYSLHARLQREGERLELLVGDGMLQWYQSSGNIRHPLLLKRVQLEFNSAIPEFTVLETVHAPEFYSAPFRMLQDVNANAIRDFREEVATGSVHPLEKDSTDNFLKRLASTLSSKGIFADAPVAKSPEFPHLSRQPVLFLRNRTAGFAVAIESILEHLASATELPSSLLRIAGIEPPLDADESSRPDPLMVANEDSQVLFSKPANIEQLQIAHRLGKYGSVLVQGPPGTGKSHTIANLLGHLLAQGKSVLVTSHTTKALRVLREHVVADLRPLCVSVLESDLDSRKQMEDAVSAIAQRLTSDDADTLSAKAARLSNERQTLLARIRELRQQLVEARAGEYREITIDGKGILPSEAARVVTAGIGKHDWIPGPLTHSAPLPVTEGELIELYKTNGEVSSEDELELNSALPSPAELMPPKEFAQLVKEREQLQSKDLYFRKELWDNRVPVATRTALRELLAKLQAATNELSEKESWRLQLIEIGRVGGAQREPWDKLIKMVRALNEQAAATQETIFEHGPKLPEHLLIEEQITILEEVIQHTCAGGRLTWFTLLTRSKWKRLIQASSVSGRAPNSQIEFEALNSLAKLKAARLRVAERWSRMMESIGATEWGKLSDTPEKEGASFAIILEDCLDWQAKTWEPLLSELKRCGFLWDKLAREIDPASAKEFQVLRWKRIVHDKLPQIFESRIDLLTNAHLQKAFSKLLETIESFNTGHTTASVITQLRTAAKNAETQAYSDAVERLADLHRRSSALHRRRELLGKIEPSAPAWASAIRNRVAPHDAPAMPGTANDAWVWRQLDQELRRRLSVSYEELQKQLESLTTALQRCTTAFVDSLTWAGQISRTNLHSKQALMGWLNTVKAQGKRTGNKARLLKLEAEARRLMSDCQQAVPVWVMPLSRVVENFNPGRQRFDVVIIDEASQADVMALVALYFAKQVIIVGDHEQVSPTAVGQKVDEVQQLIEMYLKDIPNRLLYDGKMSVYNLAQQSLGGLICLREHFRCVPEIIQFSNRLSYNGNILPLRDGTSVSIKPPVIEYRVEGAAKDGDVNDLEVLAIASLLIACSEQPEYRDKTFGVISLLGEDQAVEIDTLLRKHLHPAAYDRLKIICGNPAQFQGDERDVMFLSIVDVPSEGPLTLKEAGLDDMYKKRFNVAASRARDQMWIVHSLNPHTDLKPGDLRKRIIDFARNPQNEAEVLVEAKTKTESEFERQVYLQLQSAGFKVTPQFKVGGYRLDFVISGDSDSRAALECDGDRYHPIEKLPEDMARQAILERLGWKFIRIRGSEYFRDPAATMQQVQTRLSALGIIPSAQRKESESPKVADEIIARITRRAAELRNQWNPPADEPIVQPSSTPSDPPDVVNRSELLQQAPTDLKARQSAMTQSRFVLKAAPKPEKRDPKRVLRDCLEELIDHSFRKCAGCRAEARLYIGKKGPFMECVKCKERLSISATDVAKALTRTGAKCPECKSSVTAYDDMNGSVIRCCERGHRLRVELLLL